MTAITAENISSTNSSEAGKTTEQQQQQQQQQDDDSEQSQQQQQQRRRESSSTNNITFKDAQSDFINAVKNGISELMDKHGYSRERATTTMVRKLHRSGDNTPPSEDEVFRAMETYGLSIDDATNTLVVSKAFKNLKAKQGLSSDITAIDSLTSKLSLSNLLQEDSDEEEDFHPDDVVPLNTSYLFHRYQRRHKDSDSSSPSSSMKGVTTTTTTTTAASAASTHPSSPKNNNNKNNNKSSTSSSSSRSNNKSSSSSQQQQHKLSSKQQRKRPFVEKDANKTTPTKSLDAKTIDLKRDRADSVSDELDAKLAANNNKMLLSSQTPETPTTASSSAAIASRAKSPTQIVVRTKKRGVHHLSKTDDDLHVKPSAAAVAAVASKRPRTV